MNEEKLEQILNKMGRADIPPNAAMIAERASRNFDAVLKIPRPQKWYFIPVRAAAAAAVIIFVFSAGRWSKQMSPASQSPKITAYAQTISEKTTNSFWQQKALAAMQPTRQASVCTALM